MRNIFTIIATMLLGTVSLFVSCQEVVKKENGVLPGKFSVSATKQVQFAMGNLQYQASTKKWRFTENQYDVIGYDNENISATYDGWIDLFGWGTSGYHNSSDTYNENYMPYSSSIMLLNTAYNDYGYGPSTNQIDKNLVGTSAEYDWGVYNAISNGGNKAGAWRTLTYDEWSYILYRRTNANSLRSQAVVNGVNGYLLLPDGWTTPSGLTFTAKAEDFTTNVYDNSAWSRMESSGAVFLPCAGCRYGLDVSRVGSSGYYWTSSASGSSSAYGVRFFSDYANVRDDGRNDGFSVRLATE